MSTIAAPAQASGRRRHDLDWLRNGAIFALVPYHASRIFDGWEDFYVKDAQTSIGLTVIRAALDPWGMQLLFVIAGAASWFALRRRSGLQYLGERSARLLLPLLIGLLVLVPPQAYLAWRGHAGQGSFATFWPRYWALQTGDIMGFDGGFTVGHLWFILFLFVFSVLALPLFLAAKRPAGACIVHRLAGVVQRPGGLWLFAGLLWLTGPLPGPTPSGMNPAAFFCLFVAGYVGMADARLQRAADRWWPWSLGLGSAALLGLAAARFARLEFAEASWQSTLGDLLHAFTAWSMVVGMLGLAHCHWNRPGRWLRWLNAIAFPFYLVHQTVILLVGDQVVRWNIGALPKFAVICVAATGVSLALCEAARRWGATRVSLGIKRLASDSD